MREGRKNNLMVREDQEMKKRWTYVHVCMKKLIGVMKKAAGSMFFIS